MRSSLNSAIRCKLRDSRALPIGVWLLLGIVLLLIILLALPPYWRPLAWGMFIWIVGTAGAQLTDAWRQRKAAKWVRILAMPFIVALGGLLTTQGWDVIRSHNRHEGVIRAIANEWVLNDHYLNQVSSAHERNQTSQYKGPFLFVPLSTNQIRQALVEWVPSSDLAESLTLYVINVERLNCLVDYTNTQLASPLTQKSRGNAALKSLFCEKGVYAYVSALHRSLGELLNARANGATDKAKERLHFELLRWENLDNLDHACRESTTDPNH